MKVMHKASPCVIRCSRIVMLLTHVRSDAMFAITRRRRASRTAGPHHARSAHHLPDRANIVEKNDRSKPVVFSVVIA